MLVTGCWALSKISLLPGHWFLSGLDPGAKKQSQPQPGCDSTLDRLLGELSHESAAVTPCGVDGPGEPQAEALCGENTALQEALASQGE